MERPSKELSAHFSIMSFVCACMIVLFHASPAPDKGTFNWWFFHILGREGLCSMAVPYFFVCSGYFLAGHLGEIGWWGREVHKRIKSLVIPFFIWMMIGLAFGFAVAYVKCRFAHTSFNYPFGELSAIEKVMFCLGLHPFRDIGVLWYVRSLFFMVLASPLIFSLFRWPVVTLSCLWVIHLIMCYLLGSALGLDMYFLFDRFITITGLVYFYIGAGLRVWKINIYPRRMTVGMCCSLACLGLALLICKCYFQVAVQDGWAAVVGSLAVPFLIVGLWGLIPQLKGLRDMGQYSFQIFLMHNFFLSLISMLFMTVGLREHVGLQIPIALVRMMCAIGGAIMVTVFVRRFSPRLADVIFGGR